MLANLTRSGNRNDQRLYCRLGFRIFTKEHVFSLLRQPLLRDKARVYMAYIAVSVIEIELVRPYNVPRKRTSSESGAK